MLTSMNIFVALQCELGSEALPTLRALVLLFNIVYNVMGLQIAFRFEAFPTGGAEERPRVCVYNLMILQVHFCFERLLTELALKGSVFPLLVPQQVVLKSLCGPEFSWALVTAEKLLFFMSVDVLLQMKLAVEALVTDVAYKDVPFLGDLCLRCVWTSSVFGVCLPTGW